MTKTAFSKAFGIQELVDIFASYLSPANLFVCVQVNRQWNRHFIPKLWHTIDDRLQSWDRILYTCHRHHDDFVANSSLSDDYPIDGKDQDWFRKIFSKYGQHIRKLNVGWLILVDAAASSGVCTNLQELEIDFQRSHGEAFYRTPGSKYLDIIQYAFDIIPDSPFQHPNSITSLSEEKLQEGLIFTYLYWSLVISNHGLQRLYLTKIWTFQWPVKDEGFIHNVLSGMKGIKDVCVLNVLKLCHVRRIHEAAPTVDTVTVTNGGDWAERSGSTAVPTIKSITLIDSPGQYGAPTLFSLQDTLRILSLYPDLEHLSLPGIKKDSASTASPSSQPTVPAVPVDEEQGSALKRLQVLDSSNLISLLRYIPNLKELKVDGLSDETIIALAASHKDLEVLEWMSDPRYINETYRPDEDALHRLLASCPNLRVFNGIQRFVKANDMIREPWVCSKIEKLRCRIVGIDRLTEQEQEIYDRIVRKDSDCLEDKLSNLKLEMTAEERDVVQKFDRSREQQRQVLERLASLKHLKHLDIGFENRDPWTWKCGARYVSSFDEKEYLQYGGPTPDTLELSLESGLGQLDALKELRMFGFESVDHRLQKKEIEWMANSWPRLKLMYGLAEDTLYEVEPDRKKEELRDYMRTLRPDIEHDSLFRDDD